jgi:hypothetical protein
VSVAHPAREREAAGMKEERMNTHEQELAELQRLLDVAKERLGEGSVSSGKYVNGLLTAVIDRVCRLHDLTHPWLH